MKFIVTLKDPDGIYDSLDEAAKDEAKRLVELCDGLLTVDDVKDKVREKIDVAVRGFFEHGDYVHIEIDTDAKTATVVKR